MKTRHHLMALTALLLVATSAAPAAREAGYPLIESYTEQVASAGGGGQSYGVAVDPRGAIFVSNEYGLFEYDGATWTRRPVGAAEIAFGVASDASGRVAVGGNLEFGVFEPDASGTLRFASLKEKLPEGSSSFGQVFDASVVDDGFLFESEAWLAHWNGSVLSLFTRYAGEGIQGETFETPTGPVAWMRGRGIVRIEGARLVDVPGSERFRDRRSDAILDAEGGLLVSVRGEGLFLLREGVVESFAPEASRWTADARIRTSCVLPDGRWAFGSLRRGLMLLRRDGTIDQIIDTASGLPDDHVQGLAVDLEGGLWAALANGLVRIEVAQPLSLLDERNGLRGAVHDVARHDGELWAVTTAGVFTTVGADRGNSPTPRFRQVRELPSVGWSLLSDRGDLLVGTYEGVFAIEGGRAVRIEGSDDATTYAMTRSRIDTTRVWLGMSSGIGSIRRRADAWVWEGLVEGVSRDVASVVETPRGQLWVADAEGSVSRFDLESGSPVLTRTIELPGGGEAGVFLAGSGLLAWAKNEIWEIDETDGSLTRFAPPSEVAPSGRIGAIALDARGNLWIGSSPPVVALAEGNGANVSLALSSIRAHAVNRIVAEPGGEVLLATEHGLVRHDGSPRGPAAPLPRPAFSRIRVDGQTAIFGGANGVEPREAELPHSARRLRIEIAPLSFRRGIRYATRVEGLDAGWNPPSDDPAVELTQLAPGSYTLHARTIGPSGELSPEIRWSFRVLRPWYQSVPALVVWATLAIVALRAYGRLKSRRIRARARELQAEVSEKTSELQHAVEELSRTRDELESANVRLEDLSLHDSLTGLHNRRMIDHALADEWARARRHATPIAIVLIDIDHFKLLNDSLGHREGDACLRAIAGHLAESIVRAGDVAARIGGEEFVVLLPNTTLAGATHVAEQLRAGIEALALPHPSVEQGHITASFGVAATVPGAESLVEAFLETADRALYRAKNEGRNRVCAAE